MATHVVDPPVTPIPTAWRDSHPSHAPCTKTCDSAQMTETTAGGQWWQASDGRWYPPDTRSPQAPQPYVASGQHWAPNYPPYGPPTQSGPVVVASQTNGLAVSSLVISFFGVIPFLFGIPCVMSIVMGFVALGQIKRTGGVQAGRTAALAGIIISFCLVGVFILFIIGLGILGHHYSQSPQSPQGP